jgi:hypothetical protein
MSNPYVYEGGERDHVAPLPETLLRAIAGALVVESARISGEDEASIQDQSEDRP